MITIEGSEVLLDEIAAQVKGEYSLVRNNCVMAKNRILQLVQKPKNKKMRVDTKSKIVDTNNNDNDDNEPIGRSVPLPLPRIAFRNLAIPF